MSEPPQKKLDPVVVSETVYGKRWDLAFDPPMIRDCMKQSASNNDESTDGRF